MSEYERLKKQKDEIIESQRKAGIKGHPLVKYVLDHSLISVRKLCRIMNCDIEDITSGI